MSKTVVITGATKGIGRALAQKFAAEGWCLALCARTGNDLEQLAEELADTAAKVFTMPCDVSKPEQIKLFGTRVLAELGTVDVLINNAGVFLPGQVYNEPEGTLEALIETNLYSAYHLTRVLAPVMIERKQGHIFNMCSVASIKAYHNGGSYAISKFALLGFSKSLREELKDFNIRVTSLIPGATYTPSWHAANLPEERFMKAEDVAKLVWDVYNLSDNTVVEEVVLRPLLGDI
jgi:short-subunit dehydrogenase